MKTTLKRVAAVAVLIGCSACTSDTDGSDKATDDKSRSTAAVVGKWVGPSTMWAEVSEDGSVKGNDGCTDITGEWKPAASGASSPTFELQATRLVGCPPGVPGWEDAATLDVQDGRLIVLDASGNQVGDLTEKKS